MSRPEPGSTVSVYWNGFHMFDLEKIRIVDDPQYPGWMQIDGSVRHENKQWGTRWTPRSVFVTLREEGGVRVLDSGERLTGVY
jgi:hypothetical protein